MAYKGHLIVFLDLYNIFCDKEKDLIATWKNKVVLRKLFSRIEYSDVNVTNDFTNKEVRYFFFSDFRNRCFQNLNKAGWGNGDGKGSVKH